MEVPEVVQRHEPWHQVRERPLERGLLQPDFVRIDTEQRNLVERTTKHETLTCWRIVTFQRQEIRSDLHCLVRARAFRDERQVPPTSSPESGESRGASCLDLCPRTLRSEVAPSGGRSPQRSR